MTTTVVALGKIGLPLAVQMASKGLDVVGVDISEDVTRLVNTGRPPFPGEAGLEERLTEVVGNGLLTATVDVNDAVAGSESVVIVVPLMTDYQGKPDFTGIDTATRSVASALRPGTLVSYETTLPVGTTRRRFGPMLEKGSGSGLVAGRDFALVHSPERVFSGRVFADLRRYPKLVGGVNNESTMRGVDFYEKILDFDERPDLGRPNGVWAMSSSEAAELAKLAESMYRDVNIALANELAEFAEGAGLDVSEVIAASNSQPFSHIHRPGVAVGGHCIPVYPHFYLAARPEADLVSKARAVNLGVPARVVAAVARSLGGLEGCRVLVLGVAYRGGVKESTNSGVFDLVAAVRAQGGHPLVSDPLYEDRELIDLGLQPWDGGDIDAVIIQADHEEYQDLKPSDLPGARLLYDGRGLIDEDNWAGSGVETRVIGQGRIVD